MKGQGDMSSKAIKKKAAKAATPAAKKAAKPATKAAKPATKEATPASTEAKPAAKNNAVKGKRYTPAEKKEILQFIAEFDAKNGRGGQSQAAKKYGVTVLTLANWRKAAGKAPAPAAPAPAAPAPAAAPTPAAAPAAKKAGKRGRKPGKKSAAAAPAATPAAVSGLGAKLARLLELDKAIIAAEAQLAKHKAEFASLKASL